MANPMASIILVNYNGGKFIGDCLASLRRQTYAPLEVIVVDNASEDGSADKIAAEFSEVILVRSVSNTGFAGGCNAGAARATGDYLVFLNYDTVADERWLEELVGGLEDDPGIAIVQSKVLLSDRPSVINSVGTAVHYLGFGWSKGWGETDTGDTAGRDIAAASGAAMLIRRSVADEIGLFDETFFMYHEDADLSWRARLRGYRVRLAPASVVYHKYEFNKGQAKLFYLERNRLIMCLKNYRTATLVILLPVFLFSECGMLAYFLLKGMPGAKLRSYNEVFRGRNEIMNSRRRIQDSRTAADREIVRLFESRIMTEGADNPLQRYVANPVYALFWAAARRII
jgi:GT2 family glycosyltransferase